MYSTTPRSLSCRSLSARGARPCTLQRVHRGGSVSLFARSALADVGAVAHWPLVPSPSAPLSHISYLYAPDRLRGPLEFLQASYTRAVRIAYRAQLRTRCEPLGARALSIPAVACEVLLHSSQWLPRPVPPSLSIGSERAHAWHALSLTTKPLMVIWAAQALLLGVQCNPLRPSYR